MTEHDDLVGEIIAQVAREHGVALSRDDPILATVLLNQAILRRVLDQAVGPAVTAIEGATHDAVTHLQEHAEAQTQWIEQITLQDRSNLLEQQKALLEGWQADMERIIAGQNAGLERVVQGVVKQLGSEIQKVRAQGTPALPCPAPARRTRVGGWLVTGILIGAITNTAVLMAARYLGGQ